tara:strand:- start:11 stop:217 length:207 start_codon:yes stop_codon:yes gene_type:complete
MLLPFDLKKSYQSEKKIYCSGDVDETIFALGCCIALAVPPQLDLYESHSGFRALCSRGALLSTLRLAL